jgi:hypothetical protein
MCAERVYLLPKKEKINSSNENNMQILTNWISKHDKKKQLNTILEKFLKTSLKLNEDLQIIYPEHDMPGSSIYEMLEYTINQKLKKPIDYNVFEKYIFGEKNGNKINLPDGWKKL